MPTGLMNINPPLDLLFQDLDNTYTKHGVPSCINLIIGMVKKFSIYNYPF